MNGWRRLAWLCAGGRLFERGAAVRFRAAFGARREPPFGDQAGADFAPDTDVQVFFTDAEPAWVDASARLEKRS